MKISYPEDWRAIPPEKWKRMSLTPEAYARMRAERIEREKLAPEEGAPARRRPRKQVTGSVLAHAPRRAPGL